MQLCPLHILLSIATTRRQAACGFSGLLLGRLFPQFCAGRTEHNINSVDQKSSCWASCSASHLSRRLPLTDPVRNSAICCPVLSRNQQSRYFDCCRRLDVGNGSSYLFLKQRDENAWLRSIGTLIKESFSYRISDEVVVLPHDREHIGSVHSRGKFP